MWFICSYCGFLSAFGDDERLRALRQKAEGRRQKEEEGRSK
jgi:hypothetical protein